MINNVIGIVRVRVVYFEFIDEKMVRFLFLWLVLFGFVCCFGLLFVFVFVVVVGDIDLLEILVGGFFEVEVLGLVFFFFS